MSIKSTVIRWGCGCLILFVLAVLAFIGICMSFALTGGW